MEGLQRFEQDLYMIRDLLYVNEEIGKLVFHSSKDALSKVAPALSQVNEHIFLSPVFDTTREPFNKHTFISLTLANSEWDEEEQIHLGAVRINVFSQIGLWEMDDQRVRPISITSKIIEILDQKKLKSSHKLFYISTDLTTIDSNVAGYTLLFGIQDGGGDSDAEFY